MITQNGYSDLFLICSNKIFWKIKQLKRTEYALIFGAVFWLLVISVQPCFYIPTLYCIKNQILLELEIKS